jgi:FdhE protein
MAQCARHQAEEVERAAEAIVGRRPALAELIGFYGALFTAQEAARAGVRLEPAALAPELARTKIENGFPLAAPPELPVDVAAAQALFPELCRIAAGRASELAPSAAALMPCAAAVRGLYRSFLDADEAAVAHAARRFRAEPAALGFFLYHSLRPSLCRAAELLAALIPEAAAWRRGACPVCGSPPALGLIAEEGRRSLVCGFCWHRWPYPRAVCAFCACADPARLSYRFSAAEPEYRLELCAGCRTYLKTVDARRLDRPLYPPLEAIAGLHLDLWGEEAGCRSAAAAHDAAPAAGRLTSPERG